MDDENKLLNFEYNPDKVYEATKKYVEFKQLLKANYKSKVFLIENNIFENLSNEYDKFKSGDDLKNELKKEDIKNKIISEKIKIIENVEDIESNNLEIITNDILIILGINKKYFSDKDVNLKVLSDTIQQIIFKDKSKLNISFYDNKKHLNIIESPIDYKESKESNENKKGKIADSITDIKQSTNSINFNPRNIKENNLNEKIDNKPLVNDKENININLKMISIKKSNESTNRNQLNKIENVNNDKLSNNEISENYNLFDHIYNNSHDENSEFKQYRKNSFCLFSKNNTLVIDKINEKQNFYDNIKELYEQQKTINNLMNEVINLKNEFNDYLIVNKSWFNKLVKIFENQEIYQNELKIFDSFDKITNASNSKINDQIFRRRKKDLTEENLFKLELESEKSLKVNYPKEFILIEKESLNKFNFNFNFDINNNEYQILFGEKHIFIKDKENSKNIFVCSRDKFFFSINLILNYNKEKYFKQEIENFIQNKGGIEHYIKEKNFDIMSDSPQKNINNKGDSYGFVLILLNKKGKEKGKEKEKEKEEIKKINIYNKDNNIYDEKQNKILKITIIENSPKKTSIDNFRNCKINYNPYIYSFLLSLKKIEILKEIFVKSISQNQNNDISNLLCKFLNTNDLTIINEIYKKIYEINSNFKMNFKNLIDALLTLLHKEFNTNKNYLNKNNHKGDFDEKLVYKEFKQNYLENNDSFIQRTFFGIKEIMITYKCCGLTKYFYESFEYIYIDSELLKKSNNLNDLISHWGSKKSNEMHKCQTCNYDTDCFVVHKLIDYPEFLIIILDNDENKNKYKVNFGNQIVTDKFVYNLLNCITNSSLINKNYNVIINEENKWYIFNNDNNKKEIEKDKIEHPNVFIFQKGKENEKFNGAFNFNESYNIADYLNDSSDDDKKNNIYNFKNNIKSKNDIDDSASTNKSLSRTDTEGMLFEKLYSNKHIFVEKNKNKSTNNINNIMMNQMNNFKDNNMPKISNNISNQNQNNNHINIYNINNNKGNNYIKNNNMINNNMNNYNSTINNNNINNNNRNNNNQMSYKNNMNNNNINKNNQNISNYQMNNLNNNIMDNNNEMHNNNMINKMYNNNYINNNNINNNPMDNMGNNQMNNINNNNNSMNNNNMNNFNYMNNNNNMYNNNNYMNSNNNMCNNNNNNNNNNKNNNNNNNYNNNYNNNNQINNINNNMKLNENNGQITIYFKLQNGKEFYLDTNDNYFFGDVIQQLFRQNDCLQKEIEIVDFIFKEKSVKMDHTLKQIGIKDKSIINIIHKKID